MDDREIVVADCYEVAKMVMRDDWCWTPQRIKKAVVVAREVDIDRVRTYGRGLVYFAAYPDCFDKLHAALSDGLFEIGNPFKGSTIDPAFFRSRSQTAS